MTRKFILLDHSIEDCTGHYLEYARRVLRAARAKGFRTVLAVNQRAGEMECPEADIIDKAFMRTYLENQVETYSAAILSIASSGRQVYPDTWKAEVFAQEFRALAQRIEAANDDLVFVPTLGSVELIGIALFSTMDEAGALEWHLLFRHDVPSQKMVFRIKKCARYRRVMTAFDKFGKGFKKGTTFFYTDTEALTAQYNRLGEFQFDTLPIPIDDSLHMKKHKEGIPLIVSYLGDAREEKGFHLLPNLIKAVRQAGYGEDRVKFRIQANLPLAGSTEKAARAKKVLIEQEGSGLEVLEGPFGSDQYHQLVTDSDIILVPYCTKSYQARSSGIFAEALAAGVPTVFPRGLWVGSCQVDSGSVWFNRVEDVDSALLDVISHYRDCELRSQEFASIWRQWHSATNLVNSIMTRASERACGVWRAEAKSSSL